MSKLHEFCKIVKKNNVPKDFSYSFVNYDRFKYCTRPDFVDITKIFVQFCFCLAILNTFLFIYVFSSGCNCFSSYSDLRPEKKQIKKLKSKRNYVKVFVALLSVFIVALHASNGAAFLYLKLEGAHYDQTICNQYPQKVECPQTNTNVSKIYIDNQNFTKLFENRYLNGIKLNCLKKKEYIFNQDNIRGTKKQLVIQYKEDKDTDTYDQIYMGMYLTYIIPELIFCYFIGRILKMLDKKVFYFIGTTMMSLCSIIFGLTSNRQQLALFRLYHGFGSVLVTTFLADLLSEILADNENVKKFLNELFTWVGFLFAPILEFATYESFDPFVFSGFLMLLFSFFLWIIFCSEIFYPHKIMEDENPQENKPEKPKKIKEEKDENTVKYLKYENKGLYFLLFVVIFGINYVFAFISKQWLTISKTANTDFVLIYMIIPVSFIGTHLLLQNCLNKRVQGKHWESFIKYKNYFIYLPAILLIIGCTIYFFQDKTKNEKIGFIFLLFFVGIFSKTILEFVTKVLIFYNNEVELYEKSKKAKFELKYSVITTLGKFFASSFGGIIVASTGDISQNFLTIIILLSLQFVFQGFMTFKLRKQNKKEKNDSEDSGIGSESYANSINSNHDFRPKGSKEINPENFFQF